MRKLNLLLAITLLCFSFTQAQRQIEIHLGTGIPQGSFAQNDLDNAIFGDVGSAVTGVDIAAKIYQPLPFCKDLKVTVGANFLLNAISQDFKDKVRKGIDSQLGGMSPQPSVDITYPRYMNIPVMVGLNYQVPVVKLLDLYVNGELGVNFSSVSNMLLNMSYMGQSSESTVSVNSQQAFATRLGAGLLLMNKFSLGVDYSLLGTYAYSGKTTASAGGSTAIKNYGKIPLRILGIYLGYRF